MAKVSEAGGRRTAGSRGWTSRGRWALAVVGVALMGAPEVGAQSARAGETLRREVLLAMQSSVLEGQAALAEPRTGLADTREVQALPPAWLPQDPADSLYRVARSSLNRGDNRNAAREFRLIRERYPHSGYVGESLYYEAFALSRTNTEADLREALQILDRQAETHPGASTRRDADALRVRIRASLASMGDAGAARQIRETAGQTPCSGPEQETRMMALSALLNMDAERALPILQEVLVSRDACSAELRRRAVFLIAQHESPGTVDLLLDLAHRNPDPDPEVRRQAVFWLSGVSGDASLDALESILAEADDLALRDRALFALSQHGSARAAEILLDYARRTDVPAELRQKALFWIGQSTNGGAALQALYPSLDTDALREQALFAASQQAGEEPAVRSWLIERALDRSESLAVRKKAIFWAGQSGMSPGELRGLYSASDEPEIREQLIFALAQSDEPGAVEALIQVAREETNLELRRRAIFWLGQVDDPRAEEFLLEIIRSGGGAG